MLEQLDKVKALWGGKSQTVDNWLQSRKRLLVSYCQLTGMNTGEHVLPSASAIETFCEQLMDYVSTGHFEVFDMLVPNNTAMQDKATSLYPKLAQTTDAALKFNDNFADAFSVKQANAFDESLSTLGEALELRFAMEDELIAYMFSNAMDSERT